MLDVLRAAMSGANRVGVTSVEVTAHDESDLAPYDTLLKGRGLTTRVAAAMAVDWPLDEAAIEKLEATRRRYQRVPVFKVDAVRLTVSDGFDASGAPIEPATAAGAAGAGVAGPGAAGTGSAGKASHARRATPPRGRAAAAKAAAAAAVALATRKTDLSQTIARLGQRGWQIILQTSDAGDVDLALTAVASSGVAADAPNPKALKRRIRLELSAPVDNATVSRLARLGVIPSLQQPATAGLRNDAATANGADTARLLSSPASSATSATADDASPNQARAEVSPATAMTGASADAASDVAGDGSDATSDATPAAAAAAGTSATTGDEVTAVGAARKSAAPTGTGATAETATADEPESWPYANLLASATPFVFHSDWPAAALDPRLALSTVLLEGFLALSDEATTIADDSKISARLTRALDAYTRYAAFASADEEQNGTIAKERLADLVIFSTDLFALTPTKLLDAEVTTTIFDGKVVFIRQPEPATAGIPATQ
jgi:predicted amidohydrolase YtcJ